MLKEYRTIKPYIKKYRLYYSLGILCLFLVNGFQLVIPQYISRSIDAIVETPPNMGSLKTSLLFMILFAFLVALSRFSWRNLLLGGSIRIEQDLRQRLFDHLVTLSESYYLKQKTGDIMARLTNDLEAVRMACGWALVALFDGVILGASIVTILIVKYGSVALYLIIPLPIITLFLISLGPFIRKRFYLVQKNFSRLSSEAQETFSGIQVIKSFVIEGYMKERFLKTNTEYLKANIGLTKLWGLMFPTVHFIAGITILLLLWFGGKDVIRGVLTPGDFTAIQAYMLMMIWPMIGAGMTINMIQRGAASLSRINAILDEKPEIASPPQASVKEIPNSEKGVGIEVKELSFSYPGSNDKTLSSLNFKIEGGSVFGIFGRTGSGKSTLIRFFSRIIDPSEGSLSINGEEIRSYNLETIRSSIAVVSQRPLLFSDTIYKNITFGTPYIERELFLKAVEDAGVTNDYDQFPKGWETIVGEKGVSLSGGQKQRITVARALLLNAPILILDDAFSSVDARTEQIILERIFRKREGRTTIIISHKISTLQMADSIIVLDKGEIVQQGNHKTLLQQEGIYSEVFALQQEREWNRKS